VLIFFGRPQRWKEYGQKWHAEEAQRQDIEEEVSQILLMIVGAARRILLFYPA